MNIRILPALCAAAALSGCTALLWKENGGSRHAEKETVIAEEQAYAFGVAQKEAAPLSAGQLVLMGRTFWFVLDARHSETLMPVLEADLPQAFRVGSLDKKRPQSLPARLTGRNGSRFSSFFCLSYPAQTEAEKTKLRGIGFTEYGRSEYGRCFAVQGRIFAKPQQMPAAYRFRDSVPITVYTTRSVAGQGRMAATAFKVLLTPLTVALDTVSVVGLIGDMMIMNFDDGKQAGPAR